MTGERDAELIDASKRIGPIARREMRLAYSMLFPTVAAVLFVVLIPVLANFWISVKPVELADLRAAKPLVRERASGDVAKAGDAYQIEYRVRSSSPKDPVFDVALTDKIPKGLNVVKIDPLCMTEAETIKCYLGTLEPKKRQSIKVTLSATPSYFESGADPPKDTKPLITGHAPNALTSLEFTFENFRKIFDASEFWEVLWVSMVYTVFGTGGALLLGLFAAQLLMTAFPGRAFLRGLFLFPYVSPVIAVAFTWIFLLDPFSGTMNAILQQTGVTSGPINFLGKRGVALWTVIAFEAWRYFPLAFLFILARMQSLSADLDEAAEMDGATPFQRFWYISLPQLVGILSTLFLLRFIWTFNKFDDIFLLTGGASGTRTLTVNVYEQAFALSNLGAGAAVAVLIFFMLSIFVFCYFWFAPKEEGM
ncbi:MAG: sugar ABC transporter permease [Roseovarius sp.]|nr:sugar ABC transporter permease [Roseovarius sp.]MCY4315196.1 sugar ABC transporter permease [Roseovarius sp.]